MDEDFVKVHGKLLDIVGEFSVTHGPVRFCIAVGEGGRSGIVEKKDEGVIGKEEGIGKCVCVVKREEGRRA